jgi:cytosine/adenosine deaminase-related metal-dependent hydrolase
MKLSSGIARIPEMLEMGIPVGLGVDGSASNDGSDMLEELRVGFLLHRLNSSRLAPTGYDMLKVATMGSARLLGRDKEIGSIETGKCADFFLVDSGRLELVGACYDPKSVLGTVGLRGAVDYTVIDGEVTVEHGKITGIDEEKVVADSNRELARYLADL